MSLFIFGFFFFFFSFPFPPYPHKLLLPSCERHTHHPSIRIRTDFDTPTSPWGTDFFFSTRRLIQSPSQSMCTYHNLVCKNMHCNKWLEGLRDRGTKGPIDLCDRYKALSNEQRGTRATCGVNLPGNPIKGPEMCEMCQEQLKKERDRAETRRRLEYSRVWGVER